MVNVFLVLFLLCAVILSLLVLIQRGRGGGLAGAFGGAGGSSAFGTKTADVFTKATAVMGAIFFLLAILTAYVMHQDVPRPTGASVAPAEPSAPAGGGEKSAPAPSGDESSTPAK